MPEATESEMESSARGEGLVPGGPKCEPASSMALLDTPMSGWCLHGKPELGATMKL